MCRCGIFLIVFWVLFVTLALGQTDDAKVSDDLSRDEIIAQSLEYFENQVESRELKIKNALESFERQQLTVAQEEPQESYSDTKYPPQETALKPTMVIQGSFRSEVAHHVYSPSEFTKIKNQLSLTARGEFSPTLRYRISGRTYYDAAYDIGDHYSDSAKSDQRSETQLRDTYLDYSAGPWDLRVGKQQVVWGEAVGVFVADVVNARDLREFALPNFDDIRIPEWGANLEYTQDQFHSEFLVLPGIEFNKLGVSGSEFEYPLPISAGTPFSYQDAKAPKASLENSKIGTRFNYLWQGFDTGVFYLHSWTQSPVLYRTINGGNYDFDPQYKRLDTFGATVSKELYDVVLKGDFVYTKDDFFPVDDPADLDGIARSGRLEYLLGIDYTFLEKLDFNVQFIQNVIFDHNDFMVNLDKYNNAFSLRVSRDFLNRKLYTEFLMFYEVNVPDFLYQSKVKYNLTDSWQVAVGADIFSGNSSGTLGYFRNKSRYYSEVIYKF